MKTLKTFLIGIMMLVSTAMVAQPMNYNAIRNNARFLTDRMAYTLGISNIALLDDIYRINYDYIYGLNEYLDDIALGYRYDDYMDICAERDFALRMLLGDVIWNRLIGYDYFYRPIVFSNHRWHFGIYLHDHNRDFFHYSVPRYYHEYRGGHFFGGMRPSRGIGDRGPGMASWGPRTPRAVGHRNDGMVAGAPRPGERDGYRGGMTPNGHVNPGVGGRGEMNRGEMNRGNDNRGGAVNRGEAGRDQMGRGESPAGNRSQSNSYSSSRGGSYSTPSRSGSSSYSTPSRSGNTSSSIPSRSGGTFGGSRGSSMGGSSATRSSSSSMGGASRGGSTGGGNAGGARAGRR